MQKLLKFEEVQSRTQKSRSRIYDDMAAGTFPKPVKIGTRAVAWIASEIDEWIEQRIADREAA